MCSATSQDAVRTTSICLVLTVCKDVVCELYYPIFYSIYLPLVLCVNFW